MNDGALVESFVLRVRPALDSLLSLEERAPRPERIPRLRDLRFRLEGCRSVKDALAWSRSLETTRERATEHVFESQLGEYLEAFVAREGRAVEVALAREELLSLEGRLSDLGPRLARGALVLSQDAGTRIRELPREVLETWAPAVPRLSPGLFEILFSEEVEIDIPSQEATEPGPRVLPLAPDASITGVFASMPHPGRMERARACLASVLRAQPARALVFAFYCDEPVLVLRCDELAPALEELIDLGFAEDKLVLPIEPEPAAWALCYFHHGLLEVGRRVGPWPHRVSVPADPDAARGSDRRSFP